MDNPGKQLKRYIAQSLIMLFTVIAIISTAFAVRAVAQESLNEDALHETLSKEKAEVTKFAFIAASIAFGLGAIGAGMAISHVGAAAIGAVAEKPEIGGWALIFIALAEGLVVFGFITALMILFKV